MDGTNQNYPFSYDVDANIWTKVVKQFANPNIAFDNDTGFGLDVEWIFCLEELIQLLVALK